jgi:hypothetical protein
MEVLSIMNKVNEIFVRKTIKKLRLHYKDCTIIYNKEHEQVIISYKENSSTIQLSDDNLASLESAIFIRSTMLSYKRKVYYNHWRDTRTMNNEIILLKLIKNLNHRYNKDSYTIELTDNNHYVTIKKENTVR